MTRPMPQTDPRGLSQWIHAPRDIPPQGRSFERSATVDELRAVSKYLGLVSCEALNALYTLTPTKAGSFHLTGRLHASIVQVCVLSLEPVAATIDEILKADFSAETGPEPTNLAGDLEILAQVAIETIADDQIEIGRFCFEVLSSAIDPYPKAGKAALPADLADHMKSPGGGSGPFQDLAHWKDRKNRN